jgi:7,8-dihydropterin-6-yl-methyl-4-(beta-D-ribofuranosyl)aminobenzene 5'-phosphate synthase
MSCTSGAQAHRRAGRRPSGHTRDYDNQHNVALKPLESPGLGVQRIGFPAAAQGKTLASEWGLALHIESTRSGESRRYLLDFGFTPEVDTDNLGLMNIDPAQVDALILSHGHFDHTAG